MSHVSVSCQFLDFLSCDSQCFHVGHTYFTAFKICLHFWALCLQQLTLHRICVTCMIGPGQRRVLTFLCWSWNASVILDTCKPTALSQRCRNLCFSCLRISSTYSTYRSIVTDALAVENIQDYCRGCAIRTACIVQKSCTRSEAWKWEDT